MDSVKTSQRARLMLLLLGILILGVFGQTLVINFYLLNDFRQLEESQVRSSARLIRLWLDNFLQPLDGLARVAGTWDTTAAAVEKPGDAWQSQLLATAATRGVAVDTAALVAPDGTLIAGFARALDTGAPQPLTKEAAQY